MLYFFGFWARFSPEDRKSGGSDEKAGSKDAQAQPDLEAIGLNSRNFRSAAEGRGIKSEAWRRPRV
jgi:hypothetical protein